MPADPKQLKDIFLTAVEKAAARERAAHIREFNRKPAAAFWMEVKGK
jgi:hypothetical protein